jgi:hypothetical protein
MNAQLKPNEQAARDVTLKNRRSDVFWIERGDGREVLLDELEQTVRGFLTQILDDYKSGDDCANGRLLGNVVATVAMRIYTSKLAAEMKDDLLPSWRSRCEP